MPWLDRDKAGRLVQGFGNYPKRKQRVSDLPMVTQPGSGSSHPGPPDPHFKATTSPSPSGAPRLNGVTWRGSQRQKMGVSSVP